MYVVAAFAATVQIVAPAKICRTILENVKRFMRDPLLKPRLRSTLQVLLLYIVGNDAGYTKAVQGAKGNYERGLAEDIGALDTVAKR